VRAQLTDADRMREQLAEALKWRPLYEQECRQNGELQAQMANASSEHAQILALLTQERDSLKCSVTDLINVRFVFIPFIRQYLLSYF
jgi:hypothetical protein